MGVRLALGASRLQLVSQLIVESVVLASLGGLASLVVARWTLAGMAMLLSSGGAGVFAFTLRPVVLFFTAGLATATGVAFGIFPAWHSTRSEVATTIRANAGRISGARSAARFRATLVTLQIALATVLLTAAGLFMKSLVNVTRVDLGVHVDSVITFALSPERSGYDSAGALQLYGRVEEAMKVIPSVTSVTSALVPLFGGDSWGADVHVQGYPSGPDVDRSARFNHVGTAYFSTFGVRPIAGREFTAADRRGAEQVAVVNQTFAKKFGLGADAVGKFMSASGPDSMHIRIVGLIPDVKYSDVKGTVPPLFYVPWREDTYVPFMNFYVRTSQPETVLRSVADIVRQIDPELPVEGLKTMPQEIRDNVLLDRMISILAGAFAVLATLLAAVGLYGVLAYSVAQRTREIGVRIALGADPTRVRVMVVRQVGVLMGMGAFLGLLGALGAGRAARSLLFGLQGFDPAVLALSVAVLVLVALGAAYLPARRASQVDPIHALRYE
jgi:predicted permease